MKVYTKTGDKGKTALVSGTQVSKADPRVAAYGDVDELNAVLGLFRSTGDSKLSQVSDQIEVIQNELFQIGSILADDGSNPKRSEANAKLAIQDQAIERLENQIDRFDQDLPALKNFILPGGHPDSARLHYARTVCRRAERLVIALVVSGGVVPETIGIYLNRLSDYFFVAARWCNHQMGQTDQVWNSRP